jgi:hypothetical protein
MDMVESFTIMENIVLDFGKMIDRMEKEKKKRQREYFVLGLLLAWAWLHHGHLLRFP